MPESKRLKTKTITMYVSPKYEDKLNYLKHTTGITAFMEEALDKLVVDDKTMDMIRTLEKSKK